MLKALQNLSGIIQAILIGTLPPEISLPFRMVVAQISAQQTKKIHLPATPVLAAHEKLMACIKRSEWYQMDICRTLIDQFRITYGPSMPDRIAIHVSELDVALLTRHCELLINQYADHE